MYILHPQSVKFGESIWENIQVLAVDRAATRLLIDRGDAGPHPVFADVPEELLTVRVIQGMPQEDLSPPRCGDLAVLSWTTAASASEARRLRFSVTAVVRSVSYDLPGPRGAARGVSRVISLIALSPDGRSDPITTLPADPEL